MTPIIDSHIHLWPEHMSNEQGHSWMTPGMPLAKQHILSDYYQTSSNVEGVVYVETDVRYETPGSGPLEVWAKGPLDEIRFLRAIVEGQYGERDSKMLKGIVAWAPMDQSPKVLEEWLRVAEEVAGKETWKRVRGFRFLLQFILDQGKFEQLVFGEDFVENLKILGRRGLSFDVGVDQRSGGIWQLEAVAKAMERAHEGVAEEEKVVFVLNHLCKPDFEAGEEGFTTWKKAIEEMSKLSKTYMKLSGAFSELPDGLVEVIDIAENMRPWVEHVLKCFGAERIMFGSDWPVCNVRGPRGGSSWVAWKDVVGAILDNKRCTLFQDDKERIWRRTALEAYRLG